MVKEQDQPPMENKALFSQNIHSRYEIHWKKIPVQTQHEVKGLILANYDFNVAKNVREVDEWEIRSNNFRVSVSTNSHRQDVVLRKHIRVNNQDSILLVDKVLGYLNNQAVSVPRVIPTHDGKTFFFVNGHHYQLYEFIKGQHYRGTFDQLKDIARQIAKLHLALRNIPFQEEISARTSINDPWNIEDFTKMLDIARSGQTPPDRLIDNHRSLILVEAALAENQKPLFPALRTQVIRGDLHPHDTIYIGDNFQSFLDFEGVRVGELARDVGNACHRFARQFVVNEKRAWQEVLPTAIYTFLDEYNHLNPLSNQEMESIPALIRNETLRKLFRMFTRNYFTGDSSGMSSGELEKQLILLQEAKIVGDILESKLQS